MLGRGHAAADRENPRDAGPPKEGATTLIRREGNVIETPLPVGASLSITHQHCNTQTSGACQSKEALQSEQA